MRYSYPKKVDQGVPIVFLVTPLGKLILDQTIMAGDKILKPREINTDNIIKASLDDLLVDQRQDFEALKEKRWEEFEALWKRQEEEDMETFLVSFKKDR